MNDEHNDNDRLVSETYRELASEKTPAKLDDAVLRLAKSAGHAEQRGFPAWMRPAAWAATVGLSLAIVLEVTQVPDFAEPARSIAPADEVGDMYSVEEAFSPKDNEMMEQIEDIAESRAGLSYEEDLSKARSRADDAAPPQPALRQEASNITADAPKLERQREIPATAEREAAASRTAAVSADSDFAFELKELDDAGNCDETSMQAAESWHDCVLRLREAGQVAEADDEMAKLLQTFPRFDANR